MVAAGRHGRARPQRGRVVRRRQTTAIAHLELPAGIDAALQVMAAEWQMQAGRTDEARTLARFAVEELPGNEPLMAWETGLATGQAPELDLHTLGLAPEPGAEPLEKPRHCAARAGGRRAPARRPAERTRAGVWRRARGRRHRSGRRRAQRRR